jgi:hypothetical protein
MEHTIYEEYEGSEPTYVVKWYDDAEDRVTISISQPERDTSYTVTEALALVAALANVIAEINTKEDK